MTDDDRRKALEAMQTLEQAVLHSTPPEKLGEQLREEFAAYFLLLEMAEK